MRSPRQLLKADGSGYPLFELEKVPLTKAALVIPPYLS